MNCKFCQHPLEEDQLICPECGKNQQEEEKTVLPEEAPVTEMETVEETEAAVGETDGEEEGADGEDAEEDGAEEDGAEEDGEDEEEELPPAKQNGILLTPGKLALLIGGVVVLTALVVSLIIGGMGIDVFNWNSEQTQFEGTIPADGNREDVTCKGSYTVSDRKATRSAKKVVATSGEGELTNGQLQIFYWTQVENFLSQYGQYAAYYGLDYTQPLDRQVCTLTEEGLTWQQYFLRAALESWHSYQVMENEAIAAGIDLSEEQKTKLAAIPQELATEAGLQGFESAEKYLAYSVGAGASMQDYVDYNECYLRGYQYFSVKYDEMMPTDKEAEDYFNQHEEEYAANGLTKKTNITVDVRHILIMPEGATTETIRTEEFSEDAWKAAETKAQELFDQWKAGEATETTFAELANAHSADSGSNTKGGLCEAVSRGDMVTEFNDWCFDEERKVGDCEIVKTMYGYHIMYFSAGQLAWPDQAKSDLLSERSGEMMQGALEKYPMEVDYKKITLGYRNLAN